MSVAKEKAEKFVALCREYGWEWEIRGSSILTIYKRLGHDETSATPREAFVKADMEYYSLLECVPMTKPGSIWGTDGGGMGAMAAMNSGVFKMNKSGCSARVLNAIRKVR